MAKDLTYAKEARTRLLAGSSKLARTVAVTMGPQGKNVILGKFVGAPVLTKDGVSVAREVTLEDPVEELACQLIKEAAGRTASVAGDGTTTATVLAHEIFRLGADLIDGGYSPLYFKRGVEWAVKAVVDKLGQLAKPVNGYETLRDIASISANNDYEIGEKIAEAFEAAGLDGTVAAEASPGAETSVRFVDGVELKSGYISSSFLPTISDSEVVLSKARIFLCEEELTSITSSLSIFNKLSEDGEPVLILAKDIRQEALATLLANNKIGRLKCVAVKLPMMGGSGVGSEREWMDCLAALCGANIIGKERGRPLSQATFDDLGYAKTVSASRFSTKILEGSRNEEQIGHKMDLYKSDAKKLLGDKELDDTRRRVAFLKSKAAMITVGYSTELELKEKGDRVEDSICATRAALEEGVLPGGGTAILRAASMVSLEGLDQNLRPAASVLLKACRKPVSQIVENGHQDPEAIIEGIMSEDFFEYGYNAATFTFENLIEAGVVDPKKVTRTALQNAASISLLLINTEAIVSEQADNPSSWQPPAGWRPPTLGSLGHKH